MYNQEEQRQESREEHFSWFLSHRARQAALLKLSQADAEIEKATTKRAREEALRKHWHCWKKLRGVERELSEHFATRRYSFGPSWKRPGLPRGRGKATLPLSPEREGGAPEPG